jgi:AraC-like DNA-binding protein
MTEQEEISKKETEEMRFEIQQVDDLTLFKKFGELKTDRNWNKLEFEKVGKPTMDTALWIGLAEGKIQVINSEEIYLCEEGMGYLFYIPAHQKPTIVTQNQTHARFVTYHFDWAMVKTLIASFVISPDQINSSITKPLMQQSLSPSLIYSIKELNDIPIRKWKKHYFEWAKGAELLWKWLRSTEEKSIHPTLKPYEEERIHTLCVQLQRHPEKSYKLIDLAHSIGTNDATLKKHFKMITGKTVFTYLTHCRMEKAKTLLKSDLKIGDIALEVGYKHPTHFSAAFAKYSGLSPIEWKEIQNDKT